MEDFFTDFHWHSAVGIDNSIKKAKIIDRLPRNKEVLAKFIRERDDSNFLIHKASKALWKFSKDGNYIEPVFSDDILTEDKL